MATIRAAAQLVGKRESTLYRWRKTNPALFRAVMEYAMREEFLRNVEDKTCPQN